MDKQVISYKLQKYQHTFEDTCNEMIVSRQNN